MGFLKKYYRRIEQGRPTIQWDAIELADEEIEELKERVKKLEERIEELESKCEEEVYI